MVISIRDHTRDRYHALSISSVWKIDRVRDARVLIVGAGALGNEVGKNLAMMGVRSMTILDRDVVEVANLTRSIFFRESDHGQLKAEILKERLSETNSDLTTVALNGNLEDVLGLGLIRRMDMIFACLDNRLARRTLNIMCQKVAKAWIDGAMENLLGNVSVYLPDEGACYECTLTRVDKEIIAQAKSCKGIALGNISQGKVPTISTMGSIIAALQVQEGMRLLHGQRTGWLGGKRLVVNCLLNDFYITQSERKEECDAHFRYGRIVEVPEWKTSAISPRQILERFEADTGKAGYLRLGRDLQIGLRCGRCEIEERIITPLHKVNVEMALCVKCGNIREPVTVNVVRGDEEYAEWPLAQLSVPALDILEVRGEDARIWYEMTGDVEAFPPGLF